MVVGIIYIFSIIFEFVNRGEPKMEEKKTIRPHSPYYIGLDVGTNSVGWAVTDPEYNVLRFKGNSMWGARLFEEAKPARGAHCPPPSGAEKTETFVSGRILLRRDREV